MTNRPWPEAPVDPIMRLRALAAAIPASTVTEILIAAPFEVVWAVASDLEGELPHYVTDVRSVRVTPGPSERASAMIRGHSGLRARFDVIVRPGWCLMQSRLIVAGLAATPAENGTRFALLGALRIPSARTLDPLLAAVLQPLGARGARRFHQRVEHRMQTQ
jgi:hypothetical protein